MLSSNIFAVALTVLGTAAAAAVGGQQAQPSCVSKCWANSQYVSNCAGDKKCLCDDADFQNAMYQCLYSQCQTAQFGLALHHALGLCSDDSPASTSTVPALLRQGGDLRKRGYNTQSNSVAYTRSASRTVEVITFTATSTLASTTYTYTATYTETLGGSTMAETTTTATPTTAPVLSYKSSATSTKTRGSQSVSASAYQTYATSRAYPKGSQVPYSALTVKPSSVAVSHSLSTSSATSTSEATTSTVHSYLTETRTATLTAYVTQITDGQVQAATATAEAKEEVDRRQEWDNMRYPMDLQNPQ